MTDGEHTDHAPQESPDGGELVYVTYTTDIDRDNLEEYVEGQHPNAEHVRIVDRVKTDELLYHGEKPGYICPECGREAHSYRRSGGTRVYRHGLDDKCEWQDPEWEPPEHHPDHPSNQKSWLRSAVSTVVGVALALSVPFAIYHLLPRGTISLNGETVAFPPDLWPAIIPVALTAIVFFLALKYAPGMAGRGGVHR